MNQKVQKFFNEIIGFDGENWKTDYDEKNRPWFLYDMEKMLQNEVGSPSFLYLMNTIAYLGYCSDPNDRYKISITPKDNQEKLKAAGEQQDFIDFCNKYLAPIKKEYSMLAHLLFDLGRNRLSHVYFATTAITTLSSDKHLRIIDKEKDCPYIFVSVKNFFEDTKKAIECLYEELLVESKKSDQFFEKQEFLLNWSWKQNPQLRNISVEGDNLSSISSCSPSLNSSVPYTPPPEVLDYKRNKKE